MKEPPGISRGLFHQQAKSDGAQVLCRGLARLWIGDNVERELLSFVEVSHPGALDRADMHEDVLAAIIRLDEAVALLAIEPLHDSLRHITRLSGSARSEGIASARRTVSASRACVKSRNIAKHCPP
jgi:hypothetical protein